MAELSDEEVFGAPPKELSDADVFGAPAGQVEPGNINLNDRPTVRNPDGSVSTVRSIGVGQDGKEFLIPTVSDDGRIMSDDEARQQFRSTGRHLGAFDNIENANAYAQQLHNDQAAKVVVPSALRNAAGGLLDVAKGFIPHSLSEALGFATPLVGGIQDIAKAGKTIRDVLSGVPVEQAVEQNIPESQTIKQAETTAPYSRERFRAGFETVAGLGMAAAGARGLSETLFPKPVERAGVTEIRPAASEDMRPVAEETLLQPTPPKEVIPSAIEEGKQPESYQPEYPRDEEGGTPAEAGGRGVVEPSPEKPQEVAPTEEAPRPAERPMEPLEALGFADIPADGGYGDHPLIQFIRDDVGGILSRSGARSKLGKEAFEGNKSLWDSAPEFPDPRHNKIYNSRSGVLPDEAADAAVRAGLLPEGADASTLFREISDISENAHRLAATGRSARATIKSGEKQYRSFTAAVTKQNKGEVPINASELQVGDTVTVSGEPMKVTGIDPETYDVTLEDGSRFGVQHVADEQVIYGEHEPTKAAPTTEAAKEAPAPKLLPGEKQGDLISSTQEEPFALAGEKVTERPPEAPAAPSLAEQGQAEMFGIASPLQSVPGLGPAISKLDTLRKSFVTLFKARPTRAIISGTYDAIDNQARIAGQQAGNNARLEIGGTKMDRQAMTPIVEAQGDIVKLKAAADKVNASPKASPEMKGIYNYAVTNFERLEPKRAAIDNLHNRQLNDELANGINTDEVDGYVAHRFDMDLMTPGKALILDATGGRGGASAFFKKQRVYDDYASAIADGYIPRTMDVSDLVNHRIKAGQSLINQRQWVNGLRSEVNPIDGKPVVADLIRQPKGTFVPPTGYVTREPVQGVRVAVNEYFAPIVDALTGRSQVPASVKNFAAGIKHGNLLLDTFHASRLSQMELGLMGKISYKKGRSLLEYSDSDLGKAVATKEITQEMADYAKTNRPAAEGMIQSGLNVGGISDALYKDVLESIPGMKATRIPSYNKWLFDKLNRGVIMESAIYMRERNARLHPELSPTELDRMSAREANVYYRNLGSQGIFKSRTWKDAMRVVFLAPQWVEGMVTSEVKGYGQMLKVPYDAATKGQFVLGNVAKGMGSGIAAYMVGTQLLNLLTRGKPTWENPEQGQKWSAWVPDFIQGGNGFFLNPFSVFGEMTHDVIKYGETTPNKVDVPVKIATNKLSAVSRAFRDVTIGKDFFGRPLDSAWERAKQAAIDLAPIPIGARGLTAQYAGSQERQAASQIGLKLDVAPSAGRQISELATEFKSKQGIKTETGFSDYRDLKSALMDGNMDRAKTEYDKLLKTKKSDVVTRYFDKIAEAPYTGSKEREGQFRTTLDRQQLEIYNRAKDDQSTIRTRFFQMTKSSPGKKPFALKKKK